MEREDFFNKHVRTLFKNKVFQLILLFIVLVTIFTVWSAIKGGSFFKLSTFRNILNSLVVSSFLTIGAGSLMIAGQIDLSQAAIGAFGSMVLASAIGSWGLPLMVAVVLAMLLCAAFGALNALLVTKFRFPSFIGTLAMASIAKGLMYLFSSAGNGRQATNVFFSSDILSFIGMGYIGPIPISIVIMLVFFVAYGILMSKTRFGMKVTLIGGNPEAAKLAGINSKAIIYILFINCAILGGVAGIFSTCRLGQGSLSALTTNQFTGLTAAVLGGISFGGGIGGMGGAFLGLLILNTFQVGMGVVGVNPFWVNVFTGVILLSALAMDFLAKRAPKEYKLLNRKGGKI